MRHAVLTTLVALAASVSPVLSACAQEAERPPEQEVIFSDEQDAQVVAASNEARKSLPVFWAKFEAKPAGYGHYAVKAAFKTRAGATENIWVNVIGRADGKVTGELANEPYDLGDLKVGDQVEVDEAAITDWQYSKGDKLYGHFTTRALTARANAAQRAQSAELFSPQPLEAGAN
ncbi:DUF2314 domain-containing protein [Phenylobacterium sp. 58.2.17]|uniref:DUF2314 domain-containing protein n=1 Tax=Phenylobacterium sp. 58.2.17 TaxID=2969306 RepID=UPI0022649522|nr:DUF2314 domain-containing protein [Phenylobacterium sp. 58.2.17]MCX7589200.1 DUF2314 domain-containing protein [Phenylobacterium sp. 58.2.17]